MKNLNRQTLDLLHKTRSNFWLGPGLRFLSVLIFAGLIAHSAEPVPVIPVP